MDVDSSDLYLSSMFICHLSRKISVVESYRWALLDEPYKMVFSLPFSESRITNICDRIYCAFHKHANSKVQKPPLQLHFSLPSIIITITSNEPWNTETHKTDRNQPITNHKPWPFEPVKVKFCFLLKRSVKMIDSGKKSNRQLAFEFQNSHVCEKRSNLCEPSKLCDICCTSHRKLLPNAAFHITSSKFKLNN